MTLGPKTIAAAIADRSADDLWWIFHSHVKTLQPFWLSCIAHFSKLTDLDDEKESAHLKSANAAFELMDDWRFQRIKYVKARRNEIDSAISFIRNAALQKPVAKLRAAAAARNAAAALRTVLTSSCHDYKDDQLPELVSMALFDVAAVRTLFPFDYGTLMCFHPGYAQEATGIDVFVAILEIAAQKTGRAKELKNLFLEIERVFECLEEPQSITEVAWFKEHDDSNAQLYYAAESAFHSK